MRGSTGGRRVVVVATVRAASDRMGVSVFGMAETFAGSVTCFLATMGGVGTFASLLFGRAGSGARAGAEGMGAAHAAVSATTPMHAAMMRAVRVVRTR
jgi:hypothetical protein